jgi:serine/threonine-protein kinase
MLQDQDTETLPLRGELPEEEPRAWVEPAVQRDSILAERFHVVRHLASGGMGEVFEAFDQALRIPVALKSLRRELEPGLRAASLEREVRLARRVSHPNVVRVFEFFPGRGCAPAFFTMELLEGKTLASFLAGAGRLEPAEALPIGEQIVAGLAAVHAHAIVHGDVKSGNVFLCSEPEGSHGTRVVLGDFGVARTLDTDSVEGPEPREVPIGSPHYMAPEQLSSGAM